MRASIISALVIILICMVSCDSEPVCDVDTGDLQVSIERLDHQLFSMNSKEEIASFLRDHPTLSREFLGSYQYPNESYVVEELWKRINNESLDTVRMEVEERFGDLSDLEEEFAQLFRRIELLYPDFTPPKVQAIITGFGSSELYITDSLIIIGLEYYTGAGSTYRPLGVPAYILERYEKEYIVPTSALLLANDFIGEDPKDNSLIADMVFYGKKYYFAQEVLPCAGEEMLIWYSKQELVDVYDNQHIIWAHFIENQLLYSTSHLVKKKYLDERPKTLEIGNKCPGRIGAWLGWEIVKNYMNNNPGVSVQEMMAETDAGIIFERSEYKPDLPGIL